MTPPWEPGYLEVFTVLILFTILYGAFHFRLLDPLIAMPFRRRIGGEEEQAFGVFINRLAGILLLGVVPLVLLPLLFRLPLAEYGLSLRIETRFFLLGAGICLVAFPFLRLYARNPMNSESVPRARPPSWNARYTTLNISSWALYLLAYESCLRGYLLFSLARSMGSWPAIAVSTAIYVAIHLSRSIGEAGGSAVIGLVYGAIALSSGSILIPVIIHIFIAVTVDQVAIGRRRGEG